MKPRFNPLLAAIVAANCSLAIAEADAAIATLEPRTETRTIINGEEAMNTTQFLAAADETEPTAPRRVNKDVRVYVTGDKGERVHIAPLPPIPPIPDVDVLISNALSEAFAGVSFGPARMVKKAPYSAEVITEKIQTLPDGNQISKRTSAMTFRDSEGRTRQETRNAKGEVRTINVNDSVDGARYVISPSSKSATKISVNKEFGKRMVEINEKLAKKGIKTTIEQAGPGQEMIIREIQLPNSDTKHLHEEIRVNVRSVKGDPKISISERGNLDINDFDQMESRNMPMIEAFSRSGTMGYVFQDAKWSPKATTTQLGTKEIEGLRVEGKGSSYTIPAGEVGNKNPITVTSETWYSPDLQVTVYWKQSDPRTGDSIYRLANVKRVEQPLSLFRVPDDYKTRDNRIIGVPPVTPIAPAPPVPHVAPVPKTNPSNK